MPVSFLDLVPTLPTATVTVDTETGPAEVVLTGISYEMLADIAKRFPDFAQALDSGEGITGNREALVAMIAAALGHPGSDACERLVGKLAYGEIMRIAGVLVRLTFPQAEPVPLPEPAPAIVAGGDGLDRNSPLQLSN
jgi:hypothetical protein